MDKVPIDGISFSWTRIKFLPSTVNNFSCASLYKLLLTTNTLSCIAYRSVAKKDMYYGFKVMFFTFLYINIT